MPGKRKKRGGAPSPEGNRKRNQKECATATRKKAATLQNVFTIFIINIFYNNLYRSTNCAKVIKLPPLVTVIYYGTVPYNQKYQEKPTVLRYS
jgi:hypothetical protein